MTNIDKQRQQYIRGRKKQLEQENADTLAEMLAYLEFEVLVGAGEIDLALDILGEHRRDNND